MAREDYHNARVAGRKAYRADVQAGRYPYLPALDDMISYSETQGEYPLGRVDIPLNLIVGTKTAGRQKAFASNFMPLLGENTEFGMKWATLYDSQLNEGIRDPIKAYEFMNKFYVEEGNKRVSVMRAVDAAYIPAIVTRILPKRTEEKDNLIYYEFVDFYNVAHTNEIWFSQLGSFPALIQAIGKKPGEPWSDEFRRDFFSLYNTFSEYFLAKGGEKVLTLAEILNAPVNGSGYNAEYGLLGSNKATETTIKLFPKNAQEVAEKIQKEIIARTGVKVEAMVYGDGAFKDPVGKIWELADPVVGAGYTDGLNGLPNELKLKYLADNDFADLNGDALADAIKNAIKAKEANLKGQMASEGTTPRRLTDLIGSLCDLTSGSGDKGTPIVLVQNYFNNYAN